MMKKIALLSILIGLPILIYVFLKLFGENHYNIPILGPREFSEAKKDTIYHQIPNFEFTNQEGKKITQAFVENKIYVADFFFTRCGSICPKMSTELARVQETFIDYPEIKIISFTVDPENDTPTTLKKYADKYQAKLEKWQFLTGDKKKIYELGIQGFLLPVGDNDATVTPDFLHSQKLVLIDKQKRIRGFYDGTDYEDVQRLITEIKILQKEQP